MQVVTALPTAVAQMKAACLMLSEAADVFGLLRGALEGLSDTRWEKQCFKLFENMAEAEVDAMLQQQDDEAKRKLLT
eukprot:5179867-Prymnesium_polylepis.1